MSDTTNRWSSEVTEGDRHDVGRGIFAEGSAQDIADAVMRAARDEGDGDVERRAIAKLTFYENRAGRNLSPERRSTIDEAKELIRESLAE